jgi:hypothetical protein
MQFPKCCALSSCTRQWAQSGNPVIVIHKLCSLLNIVSVIKSGRGRLARHVVHIEKWKRTQNYVRNNSSEDTNWDFS